MAVFNGSIKVRVIEATDLKPTEWSKRFNSLTTSVVSNASKPGSSSSTAHVLDPYVSVDVDEYHVGTTAVKTKCSNPKWDEEFTSEIHNGQQLGFTVFHKTAIPPDDFVANARIAFEDLSKQINRFWVCSLSVHANRASAVSIDPDLKMHLDLVSGIRPCYPRFFAIHSFFEG